MVAFYYNTPGCRYCSTATVWDATSTTATTATFQTCGCRWFTVTATNYYREPEPLPKCEHESIIQMRRINLMADRRVCPKRKPQRVQGRVCLPILPRQRLRGWPSLKEKRQAWGLL